MTTVHHADTSYNGAVFVGAGVLDFHNGVAHADFTVSDNEAKTITGFGFTVDGQSPDDTEESGLSDMTVAELKEYAAEHDVDLGEATRKADIIKAIGA